MTGLSAFDRTLEKSNQWLADISSELHVESRQDAYQSLRAGLHALRDQLPLDLAVGLAAQLPMLLRGLFFEGWRPTEAPRRFRDQQAYLDSVASELPTTLQPRAMDITKETFKVLERHITADEATKIKQALPSEVKVLWPESSN